MLSRSINFEYHPSKVVALVVVKWWATNNTTNPRSRLFVCREQRTRRRTGNARTSAGVPPSNLATWQPSKEADEMRLSSSDGILVLVHIVLLGHDCGRSSSAVQHHPSSDGAAYESAGCHSRMHNPLRPGHAHIYSPSTCTRTRTHAHNIFTEKATAAEGQKKRGRRKEKSCGGPTTTTPTQRRIWHAQERRTKRPRSAKKISL